MNAQDALDQHTELLLPLDRRLDDHLQVVVAGVVLECLLLLILGLMIPALGLQQNLTSAYCTGLIGKDCPVQKQLLEGALVFRLFKSHNSFSLFAIKSSPCLRRIPNRCVCLSGQVY